MPKTDEATSPAQLVSDNTPPRHRLKLDTTEEVLTDPTISQEIEVRPCVAVDGRRTSWDICERPEPGAKGAVVIASCYGSLEQAERMAAALRTPASGEAGGMVERMTQRFLQWKLPEGFSPDAGISFNPEFNAEWNAKHGNPPQRHEPVGTNLFSHEQAKAMVQHMIEGTPLSATDTEAMRLLMEAREQLVHVSAITGNLEWQAELGKLVARIDALAKGGA